MLSHFDRFHVLVTYDWFVQLNILNNNISYSILAYTYCAAL
jgi:hypothetical protein